MCHLVVTDNVSEESNRIVSVLSVRPFVSTLTFEPPDLYLDFSLCKYHDHSSLGNENQGCGTKTKVWVMVSNYGNVVGLSSILD